MYIVSTTFSFVNFSGCTRKIGQTHKFSYKFLIQLVNRRLCIMRIFPMLSWHPFVIFCISLTIPYCFKQIPPFIFKNAHLTSVKHTDLIIFIHWSEIFVYCLATKAFLLMWKSHLEWRNGVGLLYSEWNRGFTSNKGWRSIYCLRSSCIYIYIGYATETLTVG